MLNISDLVGVLMQSGMSKSTTSRVGNALGGGQGGGLGDLLGSLGGAGGIGDALGGLLGGGGGGKDDIAQGGGTDVTAVDAALASVPEVVRSAAATA